MAQGNGGFNEDKATTRYEGLAEGQSLATALNNSGAASRLGRQAERVLARLTKRGVDTSGLDIADFSSGEFNPTDATQAIRYMARNRVQNATARGRPGDVANKNALTTLNARVGQLSDERGLEARTNEFDTQFDPTFEAAQGKATDLMSQDAITGEQEQALRSKIAGQNRALAQTNLSRVSSMLGMRGMQDSPASAALASSIAQDYDRDLVTTLRDMGFQVSDMNRENLRKDMAQATALTSLRARMRQSYLAGDQEQVQNIGKDMAELVNALYTQDYTRQMYEKQLDEQRDAANKADKMAYIQMAMKAASMGMTAGLSGLTDSGITSGNRSDGTAFAYDDGSQAVPGPMAPRGY